MTDDELRILRRRIEDLERQLDRDGDQVAPGAVCAFVRTHTLVLYPTSTVAYYGCQPLTPGGDEVEGGAIDVSVDSGTLLVANVGVSAPVVGAQMLAWQIDGRWVSNFGA